MSLPSIFEYLPDQAVLLCKVAEVAEARSSGQKARSVAKTVGAGLLGFGTGSLAGAGAGMLLDKAHQAVTGQQVPLGMLAKAAPLVGGAMGLAYNVYKAQELEEMRRALASKPDQSQGRIPPK